MKKTFADLIFHPVAKKTFIVKIRQGYIGQFVKDSKTWDRFSLASTSMEVNLFTMGGTAGKEPPGH